MRNLKPCPFCGSEGEIVDIDWSGFPPFGVGCSECPVIIAEYGEYKLFDTEAEAIAAWNTRAEQAIAATLGSDEPPYDELLRCLENDWHINASWDGLRKFWCIELTKEGMKLRDATHGTLTAEQVMAIAGKHQPDYCSDTHVCFDWQAIADELNEWLRGKTVKR